MKKLKISNKFYYIISEFIIKGSTSGVLFLLSYYFTPVEYGYLNLFNSILTIACVFTSLNLTRNYITRSYYDETKNISELVSTIVSFLLILSLIEILVLTPFLFLNKEIASIPSEFFFWGLIVSISMTLYEIVQSLFIARKEGKLYFVSALIHGTIFILMVFSILFLNNSIRIYAFIFGRLISSLSMSIFSFFYLRKNFKIKFKINASILLESLKYSVPLIFSTVSAFLLNYISRFLINSLSGTHYTGAFTFAQNIAMLPVLLLGAINNSFVPTFYGSLNDKKYKSTYQSIIRNSIFFLSILVLYCIMIDKLFFIFPANYQGQKGLVFLFVMSHTFHMGYMIYGNYLYYTKDTVIIFLSSLGAGLANTFLGYALISQYGNFGGALSTLISYIILFLSYYFFSYKRFDKKLFSLKAMLLMLLPTNIFLLIYFYTSIITGINILLAVIGVMASLFALTKRGSKIIEEKIISLLRLKFD